MIKFSNFFKTHIFWHTVVFHMNLKKYQRLVVHCINSLTRSMIRLTRLISRQKLDNEIHLFLKMRDPFLCKRFSQFSDKISVFVISTFKEFNKTF